MKGFTVSASSLVATALCGRCGYKMSLARAAMHADGRASCPCESSSIEICDGYIRQRGAAERARWETEPKCP